MKDCITDLTRITAALNLSGPIESYLWDSLTDGNYWDSVDSIASQLESASCSAGSWSDLIYTRDILDKLSDREWLNRIEQAVDDYGDATGESPDFTFNGPFCLSNVVTFAVDWVASDLAGRLRGLDRVYLVTVAVDSMDPSPEIIAFDSCYEAQDFVSETIQARVDHMVAHSPYTVSQSDLEGYEEQESQLVTIKEESV
tara:strand:+ start:75 stop:671 length:597 start_codon:yes stop_codon:yes gene_type:complete